MIIDHIGIGLSDYEAGKTFFSAALAPLGITLIAEYYGNAGYGRGAKPEFWFSQGQGAPVRMHLAFTAEDREQVRRFYQAALAAGAHDNGAPGIRELYHPHYYGAFVIGPDGLNIEAVCHAPLA